ncbi:MAG: hypothetical protein P1U42_04675 [Phycisphaerales bacterium]|nr:hypothetical protein [Phycisphaerales bacterium]
MEQASQTESCPLSEEPECSSIGQQSQSNAGSGLPSVTIAPQWTDWKSSLETKHESQARAESGLDVDRPIVMSGHQPIIFHCGILSKLIALDEASKQMNAQAVWIIPDQDAINPGIIRVPVGNRESLHTEVFDLLPIGTVKPGVSVGSLSASEIVSQDHKLLESLAQWLDQFAMMESLASQFGYATIEHACELLGIDTPRIIFASELFNSDILYSIVESMRNDPVACAQSYNDSVARHPDAGVRPLQIENNRIELPLWGCRKNEARVAIDSTNIDSFAREELLPRGLMMSAIARAHLADLFIHGSGGYIYDRISEEWMREWLNIELRPMTMTTATHRLNLGFAQDEVINPTTALWNKHHSLHHPVLVGDQVTQDRRDHLVKQIQNLKRKDPIRKSLYRELQSVLSTYRQEHATQLANFVSQSEQSIQLANQFRIANDRTWAYVFFENDEIASLDRATRALMN